jgi:shikimate kinase / 3-dehydroquinate synthase
MVERVVLIGLSGTGKSCLARALASRLGFDVVDLDDEIVTMFGRPIKEIFANYGESVFRAAERDALTRACSVPNRVIATGGGAVTDELNWVAMRPGSFIVQLQAEPDELLRRLRAQVQADPAATRPLLESSDPLSDLERMWAARSGYYARADVSIDTTGKLIDAVVAEAESLVRAAMAGERPVPIGALGVPTGRSDLYVAPGVLASTGRLVRQRFLSARRCWIISDSNVAPLWGATIADSLSSEGFFVEQVEVPAGESSKSVAQTTELLDRLLHGRIDRHDVVIALGGGVVGDLAGFVASIVLRGVGLVQIPTSLLAMVDSSVGGKTGIDHVRGKNLIGAFYQPQLVVADPAVLETLPEREWRAGWAEIIKHAMIEMTATGSRRADLLSMIEAADDQALHDLSFMAELITRNVHIKRAVVQGDERESGLRRVLNYGHTLGHAMEASGYTYIHGEAIGLGMRAAVDLAIRLGRSSDAVAERQNAVLDRIGLPRKFEGELSTVMDRIWSDKKAVNGILTWVLPGWEAGRVDIVNDAPLDEVEAAARAIGARA